MLTVCIIGCLDHYRRWQTVSTEAFLVHKAQNREHLLKTRNNVRFHLKPQLAPVLKHLLLLQAWTRSDTALLIHPGDGISVCLSHNVGSSAPLCPPLERTKVDWTCNFGSMLYHFQCFCDFSFNKRGAICYYLTVYLIILHMHYRKSQNTQGCMDILSISKMPQKILAKPKQSYARFS